MLNQQENELIARWVGWIVEDDECGVNLWFDPKNKRIGRPDFATPEWVGPLLMRAEEKGFVGLFLSSRYCEYAGIRAVLPEGERNMPLAVCRAVLAIISKEQADAVSK